jgi:Lar family restriction alleviation protein
VAELKPCPFCGGKAVTHACAELCNEMAKIIYDGKYGVHCRSCGVATLPNNSESEAIEAWNRRAEDGK